MAGILLPGIAHVQYIEDTIESVWSRVMLATLSLVAAGLGVTPVPDSMRQLQVDGVVYRPLDTSAGLTAPLNLAYRRGESSPAATRFIGLARRAAP